MEALPTPSRRREVYFEVAIDPFFQGVYAKLTAKAPVKKLAHNTRL